MPAVGQTGTQAETTKRKGGRPPKHPGEGKRPTLTVRVRPSTHVRLVEAATKNGGSLSEEVEQCVEQSDSDPRKGFSSYIHQEGDPHEDKS